MRNNMKYPETRNDYSRPSLPDMQFEDVTQMARLLEQEQMNGIQTDQLNTKY